MASFRSYKQEIPGAHTPLEFNPPSIKIPWLWRTVLSMITKPAMRMIINWLRPQIKYLVHWLYANFTARISSVEDAVEGWLDDLEDQIVERL